MCSSEWYVPAVRPPTPPELVHCHAMSAVSQCHTELDMLKKDFRPTFLLGALEFQLQMQSHVLGGPHCSIHNVTPCNLKSRNGNHAMLT